METTTEKTERGWTYDPASGIMARKIAGFPAITLNVGRLVNGQFKLHSVSPEVFFAAAVYGLGVRADRATANDKTAKERWHSADKIMRHYGTGATSWAIRETAEEKVAREQRELGELVREAMIRALPGRCPTVDAAEVLLAALAAKRFDGDLAKAVAKMAATAEVAVAIARIREERKGERAQPMTADDLLTDL